MKKILPLFITACFSLPQLQAQQNCSNPVLVTICPGAKLMNETNAGMIDDATATCNITGEDVCYQLDITNGANSVFISIENASAPMVLFLESGTCGTGSCSSVTVPPGDKNFTFPVSGLTTCFIWVDANTAVTYDISFGADTGSVFVNIPNTQGNLQFDQSGCASPMFTASKPFFQVSYNGVYQTNPMTLAPLFVNGTLCIIAYFENTTGIEAIKRFDFHFNSGGYTAISASPSTFPGFYNAGDWVSWNVGNDWTFEFVDAAGIGQGDFFLFPNTCLRYEFCFDVTPLTNDPVLTNVDINATSDGFGAGYTGFVNSGCCPSPFLNCLFGGGGGPGISAHSFGFAFDDPPGPLPINLLSFNASAEDERALITWTTLSEINNDYFTLQKSQDGMDWNILANIDGAGNSTVLHSYEYSDNDLFPLITYYRLKQTDFDGTTTYTDPVSVKTRGRTEFIVFPNPTKGTVSITTDSTGKTELENNGIEIFLTNSLGEEFRLSLTYSVHQFNADLSLYPDGLYLLKLKDNVGLFSQRILIMR